MSNLASDNPEDYVCEASGSILVCETKAPGKDANLATITTVSTGRVCSISDTLTTRYTDSHFCKETKKRERFLTGWLGDNNAARKMTER